MAFQMQRSRSSHSMRSAIHRPLSRASTTSAASPAPELLSQELHQHYMTAGPDAGVQWTTIPSGVHTVAMDPMMNQHLLSQQMHPAMDQYRVHQYQTQDGQFMMADPHDYGRMSMQFQPSMSLPPSDAGDDRRRKNSAATATNDKELRELLNKNESRALKDVAQEVIQKERTPQAEKTKQLFAMLWLRKVCKPAKTSVPRNRVYSKYATRCGTERVVPLNPASFGKLVRVIFPGIQTRRLGVRGESKYHYVDLALDDDEDESQPSAWSAVTQAAAAATAMSATTDTGDFGPTTSTGSNNGVAVDFGTAPKLPADTSAFPSTEYVYQQERPVVPEEIRGPPSTGGLFAYPDTRGMSRDSDGSLMYQQILRFPSRTESNMEEDDTIALPDIQSYCPPKTDIDTADALVALYRTHCTSLVDCIRFCKEKQFFRLFTSFHGTLTVPVQKLFSHPSLAPWIKECDYLMYQKMVRFVSRLTLQAAPPVVITILNNISTNLHAHISKTFQTHAAHVLEAKLQPAAIFASLLHRLIRVNAAAHAAANLLTIDANREQMWREWVTMVNPKRVMEGSLPDCGYDEVYKVLTIDIRGLLEPLHSPPFPDNPMFGCDNQAYASTMSQFTQSAFEKSLEHSGSVSTENVLDRWSAFLLGLPARFPKADTRTLLACISSVGTAALRDITIMGGASYQTWWVMKIFVDEMTLWLAAMGGFLNRKAHDNRPASATSRPSPLSQTETLKRDGSAHDASRRTSQRPSLDADAQSAHNSQLASQNGHASSHASRPHSMHSVQDFDHSIDMGSSQHVQSGHHMPGHQFQNFDQPQDSKLRMQVSMQNGADVDDSGIGMGVMDDDGALARYGLADLGNGNNNHGIGINVI